MVLLHTPLLVYFIQFNIISGARYHLVATYPVISLSVALAKPKSKICRTTITILLDELPIITLNSQSSFTAMLLGFKS